MFLNPVMLLGLAAIGIPIAIHLLNKRKYTRIQWAAMRFLQVAVSRNQRRLRLEDLLLLLARCIMIALLALALARPALQEIGAIQLGRGTPTAVLIIDHSYSMSAGDGVQSRFEQAKIAATEVIDALPVGSSVAVLLASDAVRAPIPEPTRDLNLARSTIEQLHLTDRSSELLPAIRAGLELLQRRGSSSGELYVITDGQRLAWRQLPECRQMLKQAAGTVRSHIILTGAAAERNVAISDLKLTSGLAPFDQPLRFEVQVANFGTYEATNVRVTLAVNDGAPADDAIIPSIPPGERRSVSLHARLRKDAASPYHAITAQLSAPDAMPADDRRTIIVRGLERVRVLLVDGQPGREARDSEVFFLRHALQPVPPAEIDRYFVQTRTILPAELEQTRLDEYDAVVLANVADVTEPALRALGHYLRGGGRGVILFPGPNTLAWSCNARMGRELGMLPALLGEPVGDAKQNEQYTTFSAVHLRHPIASLWSDPAAGSVAAARFYRHFPLHPFEDRPTPEAGPVGTILFFSDGQTPAVMERDWGRGKVVLFASTADTEWNDLAVRPGLFVPLMHRILGAIVQRQDEHLNVPVGQPLVHRPPVDLLNTEARIRTPLPDQDSLAMVEWVDGAPLLRFTETDWNGVYDVALGDSAAIRFAAQANVEESSLESLDAEEIHALSSDAQVVQWGDELTFRGDLQAARTGTELWLPLAVGALVIAAVETFLAQWFSRSNR